MKEQGFTFIEFLIVVAVVGIVASIVIRVFNLAWNHERRFSVVGVLDARTGKV